MEGIVTEVNERHLVAAQTAHGYTVFEPYGPYFQVGDTVSWEEGMGEGDVVNRTRKARHRVSFHCRNVEPATLYVHMRGQV